MLTSKSNKVNTQKLESKPRVQTQMYDDSIGTTTYCMIICMKSRLTSFSYDSVIEGCISVKCQLMTVNFVGFGCQPGFRLHTSRQSFEPSYTRIQALLVFFLSFALASQPFNYKASLSHIPFNQSSEMKRCYISLPCNLYSMMTRRMKMQRGEVQVTSMYTDVNFSG